MNRWNIKFELREEMKDILKSIRKYPLTSLFLFLISVTTLILYLIFYEHRQGITYQKTSVTLVSQNNRISLVLDLYYNLDLKNGTSITAKYIGQTNRELVFQQNEDLIVIKPSDINKIRQQKISNL